MTKQTALYEWHLAQGARMVDFAGWQMPLQYASQLAEHKAVREAVGFFDVSHMRPLDIEGKDARSLLRHALANDVAKLDAHPGKALYSTMLQMDGGIIDDLIVYYRGGDTYRIVLNASGAEADTAHFQKLIDQHAWQVTLSKRSDLGIVAVQGPKARVRVADLLQIPALESLKPFTALEQDGFFIGRTGYTGEDGVEIIAANTLLPELAGRLLTAGIAPAGLAARDSLRLEAGLDLYGQDMDTSVSPYASNLGWTVDLRDSDRDFMGRNALEAELARGEGPRLIGIALPAGIPRHGYVLEDAAGTPCGVVTSGIFSPSLQCGIALARVDIPVAAGSILQLVIRGARKPAMVVKPPFWRQGAATFSFTEEC
ncbi:glycine cleavage system aminomethyltransferase GcvT [Acidithiobacillus sp. HP-6]|uniref:glycine cleavage system aminomethyltransferase GcvT n=1 Tax=unclassified Acidithiobacillus TaxID=2614800 RepID=UPI00187A23AC|nr:MULTISPECIES: glycine cleavage system aminomethyltransferase GcvT [unclassified Acidithiobacillus]MBE7564083.1 glycine cleavage system aminomethyltransferase GcvT [Acidithiobacillus sp. HP-6]MBE7570785.1 glycine cleavage system aminomethyltransferase GcvT [Acidithiobacillus sp. HP-2]